MPIGGGHLAHILALLASLCRKRAAPLAVAAVAASVALVGIWSITRYPVWVWNSDDYGMLMLAHIVHFDWSWVQGNFATPVSLVGHPGIPFYLVSALSYLIVGVSGSAGLDRLNNILDKADALFSASNYLAVLVTSSGVAAMTWALTRIVPVAIALIAMALALTATDQNLLVAIKLQNDSFGFLTTSLPLLALIAIIRNGTHRYHVVVLFGALSALAYLNKLLYVGVPMAGFATVVANEILQRHSLRQAILSVSSYVSGLAVTIGAMAYTMGSEATGQLFNFHWRVIVGSGHYGAGSKSIISGETMRLAYNAVVSGEAIILPIATALIVVIISTVVILFLRGLYRRDHLLLAIWSIVTATVATAGVIKQYAPHYLIAVAASLPPLVCALHLLLRQANSALRKAALILASASLVVFCIFSIERYFQTIVLQSEQSSASQRDWSDIQEMMPRLPKPVVYTYHQSSKDAGTGFILYYSGVRELIREFNASTRDNYPSMTAPAVTPKTVIVDKSYFPTVEQLHRASNLDPLGSLQIAPSATDTVVELRRSFVLVKQ